MLLCCRPFVFPTLIHSQNKDHPTNRKIIPFGKRRIFVTVQERINQGQKAKRHYQPVGQNNLASTPGHDAAQRKGRDAEPQYQVFPKYPEDPLICEYKSKGRNH